MNTIKLLWQFKWIALATLVIEWLILAPVLLLLMKFGDSGMAVNLAVTPIGSSNFFGVFIDAISAHSGFSFSLMAFAFLLPIYLLVKLALATGTMASIQNSEQALSAWLSQSGKHFLRAIGLLLRWLIVPIILCGATVLLFKLFGGESKKVLLPLLATSWFISLSWLFLSLNGVAANERWALKSGGAALFKNIGKVLVTVVVFVALVTLVQYIGWQNFVSNSEASTGVMFAAIAAFVIALLMRFNILYWQTAHVLIWQKQYGEQ